jgi:hypothetical protein
MDFIPNDIQEPATSADTNSDVTSLSDVRFVRDQSNVRLVENSPLLPLNELFRFDREKNCFVK